VAITYVINSVTLGNGSGDPITSGSLTLAVDDIITAACVTEDNAGSGTLSIANSGSALSWNQIVITNTNSNAKVATWWAKSPDTTSRTVTVTPSAPNQIAKKLDCIVHTGAHTTNPVPVGNVFSGTGATDVSQSITPTASGSALWMFAGDWNATNTFAAIADCTLFGPHHSGGHYTGTAVRPSTQPRTDAAAFTIGETDTAGKIAWVAFEVQAAAVADAPEMGRRIYILP